MRSHLLTMFADHHGQVFGIVKRPLSQLGLACATVSLAGALASCSSSPNASRHSSTSPASGKNTTGTTVLHGNVPTTAPNTALPPITVAGVEITISGSVATVKFTGPAVTGSLNETGPAFSNGGKGFGFSITGVTYKGGTVTAQGPPASTISQATVSSSSSGVAVTLTLSKAATSYKFSAGNNQVVVTLS